MDRPASKEKMIKPRFLKNSSSGDWETLDPKLMNSHDVMNPPTT